MDLSNNSTSAGQRSRFRQQRPPSAAHESSQREPIPDSQVDYSHLAQVPVDVQEESAPEEQSNSEGNQREDIINAGGSMALATLISRITGFLRTVFIGSALGVEVASSFNLANTLPNLITELVLGAVLTSLVVPVLVRAEKEDPDRGEAFIRRLLTITFSLTITVTILAVIAAPFLVHINLDEDSKVNVGMSTAFAYLLLPQIVFYAMFAVFMAVLNTKGVFKPGAWAPVVNNVVTLLVLSLYYLLPRDTKLQPTDTVTVTDPHILLLGLGTTAGVVVQACIMIPYLRKAGINMRPLWGIDHRLRAFGGMALAIVVYVAISQLGFTLNNRIAAQADAGGITYYMQAWQLLQVPYGVIGVTLLTAVMPRLSRNAADGNDRAVSEDLSSATKLTLLTLIPVIVFFTVFGTLMASALFHYGDYSLESAHILGLTVSFSAFTLIPYSLVLLHLRVFYAREEVWTPTFIIAGITITKLSLAYLAPLVASEPRLVVILLGAANGFGFIAGAVIGDRLLRRSLGDMKYKEILGVAKHAAGAAILAAFFTWLLDKAIISYLIHWDSNPAFLIRFSIVGVIFLMITAAYISKSSLPEVATLGAVLSRIPGLSKLLKKNPSSLPSVNNTLDSVTANQVVLDSPVISVLPPLSAGRVRGPRLVPGAPIVNGRFRLLVDHGGSPAARFWQAREVATDKRCALTIIDPVLASDSGTQADSEKTRQSIVDRTAALAQLRTPGMARIIEVIDAQSTVVVVAEWHDGAALSAVADTGPNPVAAGYALAYVADAISAADATDSSLGIDHRNRLRISTEGKAYQAFPGVLPRNNHDQDIHGVAVALGILLAQVPSSEVPEELTEVYKDAKTLSITDASVLAQRLRAVGRSEEDKDSIVEKSPALHTPGEVEIPIPEDQAGFGVAPEQRSRTVMVSVGAIAAVFIIAIILAVIMSFLGNNRNDSPLTKDSLKQGEESVEHVAKPKPQPLPLSEAREWLPMDGRGDYDSQEMAPLIIDGDPSSSWSSDQYLDQLGPTESSLKEGIGLLTVLPEDTELSTVTLDGLLAGTRVEIRTATGDPQTVADTTLLGTIDATDSTETINLNSSQKNGSDSEDSAKAVKGNRLILWITALPMPNAASVGELSATGIVPDSE